MLRRNEIVPNLYRISRSSTNNGLRGQVEARPWLHNHAWATIDDYQVPKDCVPPAGGVFSRCNLLEITCNCNHDLHQKEVEQNDE